MSFIFDGTNDDLTGQFASSYASAPITLAVWIKVTTHPVASRGVLSLGDLANTLNQSVRLRTGSTDDQWAAVGRTTGDNLATVIVNSDAAWAGYVGVFTTDSLRDVYFSSISNTGQDTNTRSVNDTLDFIIAGREPGGTLGITGRLAELAMWNVALSAGEITSYLAGTAASSIAAANLIGYWPLSSSDLTNQGIDTGGDLTASGAAAFDADHPTITSGLAPIRLIWRM